MNETPEPSGLDFSKHRQLNTLSAAATHSYPAVMELDRSSISKTLPLKMQFSNNLPPLLELSLRPLVQLQCVSKYFLQTRVNLVTDILPRCEEIIMLSISGIQKGKMETSKIEKSPSRRQGDRK